MDCAAALNGTNILIVSVASTHIKDIEIYKICMQWI